MIRDFITLPDVHDIERKVRAGKSTELTELEYFVLMHEPTKWPDCRVFREQLQAALEETRVVELRGDSQRLDWMERYLQRPVEFKCDDGTVRNVGSCWVLVSPFGLTLRETVDAAMKGEK